MDLSLYSGRVATCFCLSLTFFGVGCPLDAADHGARPGAGTVAQDPAAAEDAGATASSGFHAGETLQSAMDPGLIATSTVLSSGDVETELRDHASFTLLAKAWFSTTDQVLEYALLETEGSATGRGEVRTIELRAGTLEHLNRALAHLWLVERGELEQTASFVPYVPGCHVLRIPFEQPNEELNHCIQHCCATFQAHDYAWGCDELSDVPPIVLPPGSRLQKLSMCAWGQAAFGACIGSCTIFPSIRPASSPNWDCEGIWHRCFDSRCGSWPTGTRYCARNCFQEASPCDVRPEGATEFCNYEDGAHHDCETGDLRRGYWAADCDSTVSSCECRARGLWRCVDERCPEGRDGYCGVLLTYANANEETQCDYSDPDTNPCCGARNQTCCAGGRCSEGNRCMSGTCRACGGEGQPPCDTADGLRCNDGLDFRGTGTCQRCGWSNIPNTTSYLCCTNSVQYRRAGNDPCPDCSRWSTLGNGSQCVADRCGYCGQFGQACCPENRMVDDREEQCGIEWYEGTRCAHNAPCQSGICSACGRDGEACCPGGGPWERTNYCIDGSECRSGRCVAAPTPPQGDPELELELVSSSCLPGSVVANVWNVGGPPPGPVQVIVHMGGSETPGRLFECSPVQLQAGCRISETVPWRPTNIDIVVSHWTDWRQDIHHRIWCQ